MAPSPITAMRLPGLSGQLVGDGEAERRPDRRGGMRRAEGIVFALAALGEAGQAAARAKGADAAAAPGQDLVRIALVPDIPDQHVLGVSNT